MAETYVNFLGGSPLNRLSWLRTSQSFLNSVAASPATRWVVFKRGEPLIVSRVDSGVSLARLTTADVRPLLGSEPFFGQGQNDGEIAAPDVHVLEAARFRGAPIVFLGLDEPLGDSALALPPSTSGVNPDLQDPQVTAQNFRGTPYFSLDVSGVADAEIERALQGSEAGKNGAQIQFSEPRAATRGFSMFDAALFASARSMVDWNDRNKFCAGCGSPVYSLWAGWKLTCSSLVPWADNRNRKPCPTVKGLHNFQHPRSDAVVIMAVVNEANDKILLGRNKKFPAKFYSTLAGFMEPGESFEDAVKREIWEEAGVKVWNVTYHSTQPWPYPASLMIGFYATGDPAQPIRTDLDNELDDAQWFTREQVLAVLAHEEGTTFTRKDYKQMNDIVDGKNSAQDVDALAGDAAANVAGQLKPARPTVEELAFRVPPISAIAGVLIYEWAHGKPPPVPAAVPKGRM